MDLHYPNRREQQSEWPKGFILVNAEQRISWMIFIVRVLPLFVAHIAVTSFVIISIPPLSLSLFRFMKAEAAFLLVFVPFPQ